MTKTRVHSTQSGGHTRRRDKREEERRIRASWWGDLFIYLLGNKINNNTAPRPRHDVMNARNQRRASTTTITAKVSKKTPRRRRIHQHQWTLFVLTSSDQRFSYLISSHCVCRLSIFLCLFGLLTWAQLINILCGSPPARHESSSQRPISHDRFHLGCCRVPRFEIEEELHWNSPIRNEKLNSFWNKRVLLRWIHTEIDSQFFNSKRVI